MRAVKATEKLDDTNISGVKLLLMNPIISENTALLLHRASTRKKTLLTSKN
jgi:hypothetical protein